MASGDPVVQVLRTLTPGASFAYLSRLAGGSTPAESYLVWTFPDTGSTYLDYLCQLEGYDGGGLTFRIGHRAGTAGAGLDVVWQIGIRRIQDDAEDTSAAHTYDFNTVTAPVASAATEVAYDEITFTNGADMDSWADRELAIVRVLRDPANADDDLGNTAYLWSLVGRET